MELAAMRWPEADATDPDVVLLPVGSTEQHGPHAPLGTDTIIAEAVASRTAASSSRDVLVTPALPLGVAEEHRGFAGTLWLSPDTFRQAIRETVTALVHHGWERVIVVNGHGGNVDALREACALLTRHDVAVCVPFTWFAALDLPADLAMGHGGAVETAALLALQPDLVDDERIDAAAGGGVERWGEWVAGVNLATESVEFTENGVVGDPRAADADLGERLLAEAEEALHDLVDAVADRA